MTSLHDPNRLSPLDAEAERQEFITLTPHHVANPEHYKHAVFAPTLTIATRFMSEHGCLGNRFSYIPPDRVHQLQGMGPTTIVHLLPFWKRYYEAPVVMNFLREHYQRGGIVKAWRGTDEVIGVSPPIRNHNHNLAAQAYVDDAVNRFRHTHKIEITDSPFHLPDMRNAKLNVL